MKPSVDQTDLAALEPNKYKIKKIYIKDFVIIKNDGTEIDLSDVIQTEQIKNNKM